VLETEPYLRVRGMPLYETNERDMASEALMRAVLALFEKVVSLNPNLPDDSYVAAMNEREPGSLADLLAHVLDLEPPQRQELLETLDANSRLQRLSIILGQELDVLELEDRIQNQVQQEVDKSQREYYLREQMRAIQTELGEADDVERELTELREKIAKPRAARGGEGRRPRRKWVSWRRCRPRRPKTTSSAITSTGCSTCRGTRPTEDNLDVQGRGAVLERNHYGLPRVKERILEHIAVRKLAQDKMKSPILCFVGPPGTGKTSLGKSIAEALGRKFVRRQPGRRARRGRDPRPPPHLHRLAARPDHPDHAPAGTVNPLFMLDEIDKLGRTSAAIPPAALLEVLDPEQNHAFSGPLSRGAVRPVRVMFITTANLLDPIPPASATAWR
jgi:ATP-dependent Lon protease